MIKYKDVEVRQQELCVLSGVNLDLHAGELVYLIGKVGSGKSSLLKTFYAELDVVSGEAEVLGYDMCRIKRRHVPELRRKLGVIFQDFQLLIDRTVYHNLEFVLKATGWKDKAKIKERIMEVLALVGMERKGYKFPNELSGGEQQRIAIARAILNSPQIILADEPTGNLDETNTMEIMKLLEDINRMGTTVIVITHSMSMLESMKKRVISMEKGRIVSDTGSERKIKSAGAAAGTGSASGSRAGVIRRRRRSI